MNSTLNNPSKLQKSLWFFLCIAILGVGFFSFVLLKTLKPVPEQKDSALLIPTVQTAPLQHRQSPLLIDGNGIVVPTAAISVSSQVNGEVISLHPNLVSGGDFKKGEILIQVDRRTFEANLKEAEANQRANQSTLEFITKQLTRLQSLMDQGFIGEETLDDARIVNWILKEPASRPPLMAASMKKVSMLVTLFHLAVSWPAFMPAVKSK